MNIITELWDGARQHLENYKDIIGIKTAEKAEPGKATLTKPPGCLVWLDFEPAFIDQGGECIFLPINVVIFCISGPQLKSASALDAALDIAVNVINSLSGTPISGWLISLAADKPIEIVDASSNNSIVAVTFNTRVSL